jgi:hypothetical protein
MNESEFKNSEITEKSPIDTVVIENVLKEMIQEYGENCTLSEILNHKKPIQSIRFKFPCDSLYKLSEESSSEETEYSWITIPQAIEAYFDAFKISDVSNGTYAKISDVLGRTSLFKLTELFINGIKIDGKLVKPVEVERAVTYTEIREYIKDLYITIRPEYNVYDYFINLKSSDED